MAPPDARVECFRYGTSILLATEPLLAQAGVLPAPVRRRIQQASFSFIDLFAGIGGFHIAAAGLGGRCVFASESDCNARKVYQSNFQQHSPSLFSSGNFAGDITQVDEGSIPPFSFLFAGFPCQPFSKGGFRRGFADARGTLFYDVARIIARHEPDFVLLENVQNMASHDGGRTYAYIRKCLANLGYALHRTPLILSPDDFGVSVIRKRLFIPAIRRGLLPGRAGDFGLELHAEGAPAEPSIYSVIDNVRVKDKYYASAYEKRVLEAWNDFYKGIDIDVIGFPVWAEQFKTSGSLEGQPEWKRSFILKNRALYRHNRRFIDKWLRQHKDLSWMKPTHRKMEWQAGREIKDIYEGLIQFRPSGVRIKRPDKFSTLVAMVQHQIVGRYMRRLTPDETKRLQSFPDGFRLHQSDNVALKQLGNSVNVKVVSRVISGMLDCAPRD